MTLLSLDSSNDLELLSLPVYVVDDEEEEDDDAEEEEEEEDDGTEQMPCSLLRVSSLVRMRIHVGRALVVAMG